MGQPTTCTLARVDAICERLAKGEPLAAVCRDEGMPKLRTVYDWQDADPEVAARIARAREAGEDWIAAECLKIADSPVTGEETEVDADGKVVKIKRGDMIQHRKLQIETRLKLLAKWNPRKWGDRLGLEHGGPGGGPIQVAAVDASKLSDAALRELMNARRLASDSG